MVAQAAGWSARGAQCAQFVALGLVVALCAACGRAPIAMTATPTAPVAAPAIPTPPPASPLSWTPHLPPVAAPAGSNQAPVLAVAQSDGTIAYMCAPTGSAAPASVSVWVTRDRGATWTPTTRIAVSTGEPIQVAICSLVVDANQAGTAIVRAGVLPPGGCVPFVDCVGYVPYVTVDFGKHWSPLHGPLAYPRELATRGGVTYALFSAPPRSASMAEMTFVKSSDGMRTWTPVTIPTVGVATQPLPGQEQVFDFWLNPINGALLALTSDSFFLDEHFWSSADGVHWTQLNAPPFPFDGETLAVQQPFTNAPWRICGGDNAEFNLGGGQTNTHLGDIACTADGGAHWVIRHVSYRSNGAGLPDYTLLAIADDGDLLLSEPSGLERFAIGAGGVDALGMVPNAGLPVYAAGGGDGVLWVGPSGGYQDADPQGRIFTASYA